MTQYTRIGDYLKEVRGRKRLTLCGLAADISARMGGANVPHVPGPMTIASKYIPAFERNDLEGALSDAVPDADIFIAYLDSLRLGAEEHEAVIGMIGSGPLYDRLAGPPAGAVQSYRPGEQLKALPDEIRVPIEREIAYRYAKYTSKRRRRARGEPIAEQESPTPAE